MQSTNHTVDDLPTTTKPTRTDEEALQTLKHRLAVIRDRVRGVALGHHTGFYLFGRAGTSKTYTIRRTLETCGVGYYYHDGHLTPIGLFDLLKAHPDQIIVLDDVSTIHQQPVALQILLAALGRQPDEFKTRTIKYQRQGRESLITFTGGIICISNLPLNATPLLTALKSRVHYLQFDPTDTQIAALMRSIAAKGWPEKSPVMTPAECRLVTDFLIAETQQLNVPLDMRMLVDKAFPDYMQHRCGHTEAHWKDLVLTTLQERLVDLKYTPTRHSRANQKSSEQQVIREIMAQGHTAQERLNLWTQRTEKSARAFYRRLAELGASDTVTLPKTVMAPVSHG